MQAYKLFLIKAVSNEYRTDGVGVWIGASDKSFCVWISQLLNQSSRMLEKQIGKRVSLNFEHYEKWIIHKKCTQLTEQPWSLNFEHYDKWIIHKNTASAD